MCAYLCYLVALLIGVATGVVMFTYSFFHNRESRIIIYNNDIQIWNDTKRTEFANNTFKVLVSGSTSSATLQMQESESIEHNLQVNGNSDISSYSPLYK